VFAEQLRKSDCLFLTNTSSYRRGGPLPNYVGVKYENKNMVTGPDGALHQE
jgi:SH3-like domain-containing protein